MRAILNFLAMMLASVSSHLGGGEIKANPVVASAPMTVASNRTAVPQPTNFNSSLSGAMSAIPVAMAGVQPKAAPEPMVVVKYVKTPSKTTKRTNEAPKLDEFLALMPAKVRALAKVAVLEAKAANKLTNVKVEFRSDAIDCEEID